MQKLIKYKLIVSIIINGYSKMYITQKHSNNDRVDIIHNNFSKPTDTYSYFLRIQGDYSLDNRLIVQYLGLLWLWNFKCHIGSQLVCNTCVEYFRENIKILF